MYWQEQNDEKDVTPDCEVTDILFNIECKLLPVDHAFELFQAISKKLPWLQEVPQAAIHAIHVAESGNGWMRPPDGDYLHLSKRTKLILRLPLDKLQDTVNSLSNTTIHIDNSLMTIGRHKLRPIQASKTTFARYVVCEDELSENDFLHWVLDNLRNLGVQPKKMLCGRPHRVNHQDEQLFTRSLMVADLSKTDSILLQQHGLGFHRLMGCGIFLPHKGIDAIKEAADNKLPSNFGL